MNINTRSEIATDTLPNRKRRKLICAGMASAAAATLHDWQVAAESSRILITDVTLLNPVYVNRLLSPRTTDEIQRAVATSTGPICMGGGRYSMGGQIASAGSLHLDMRQFNRVVYFSPKDWVVHRSGENQCAEQSARARRCGSESRETRCAAAVRIERRGGCRVGGVECLGSRRREQSGGAERQHGDRRAHKRQSERKFALEERRRVAFQMTIFGAPLERVILNSSTACSGRRIRLARCSPLRASIATS